MMRTSFLWPAARVLLALAGILSWTEASAQAPPAALYDGPCEIHFWVDPAYDAQIDTFTETLNNEGRKVASHTMLQALPLERANEIVRASDWTALTGLQSVTVFREEPSREANVAWSRQIRATPSQAACYFEVRVDLITFQQSPVWGRKLRMRVMVANYSTGLRKPKRAYDYGSTAVPHDVLGADPASLRAPFEQALRINFDHVMREKFSRAK